MEEMSEFVVGWAWQQVDVMVSAEKN